MKKTGFKAIALLMIVIMLSGCNVAKEEEVPPVLSATVMEIEMGRTNELTILNYSGEIKWSSSDNSIATVSQAGVITPVSIGGVAITAEIETGDTMTCVVEIMPGKSSVEEIVVTSMYSSASDITLNYNDTPNVTLKAECSPLDPMEKLKWESSNDKIATVSADGLVTAVGNGMVEISASALNGVSGKCIVRIKNVPASVSAQAAQRVQNEEIPVIESEEVGGKFTSPVPVRAASAKSSIIISDKRVYLSVAESFTLTYAVGNINDKSVRWTSSDKAVAIVKNGVIVGIGEGLATVSAVTVDGAVASCQVAVGKEAISTLKSEAGLNPVK